MKKYRIFTIVAMLFLFKNFHAQKGHHHGGHAHQKKMVVVHRSPYRPHKVIVYHPYWHPKHSYNRRWVFFPKYNLYWDNWRNHYVFLDGTNWLSQPTAPPIIVNVNLENEKNVELSSDDDDVDDVYKNNIKHKEENKSE